MLAERVMEWTRQWEQEGHERGRERTLNEVRAALVGLLEERFGSVPDVVRQRIAEMGSAQEMVALSARVATAPSLDALGLT